ncbi:MAG: glycoside hydrolase family 3 N-terminal domain-containing protein [Candidatus Izemoplasmatales bacterium]|jgi:beta-glucosidase
MNGKFVKILSHKIFTKKRLWGVLSIVLASFAVVITGGLQIANSQSAAINHALGISGSEINYSTDEEYQYFKSAYSADEYAELQADYLDVCEQIEGEGLVLLKNENNALPLAENEKVGLFFTGSVFFNYATSGSSSANTEGYTDFKTVLEGEGLSVNSSLWDFYEDMIEEGYGRYKQGTLYVINEVPYDEFEDELISTFSTYSTAIVNIARSSGEGADLTTSSLYTGGLDGSYLSLSQEEFDTLEALTEMKKVGTINKIIVILNSSATIQLDFLDNDSIDVDSCLWVGNVGKSGIFAVAKALTGKIVPSGKLSDTYLKNNFSSPAMMQQSYNNYKKFMSAYENAGSLTDDSQKYYGVYSEGIYVGYRYYETRYTDYVNGVENTGEYNYSEDVAYPFGYGLSYADFSYSDFSVQESEDGKSFNVSVTVKNNSATYDGKEAVCIYLQKPYTDYDKANGVEKAAVELVGYSKTGVIAHGGQETVTINVKKEQFKSYDANGAKTYIVDAGQYYLTVANGAHEAANNILALQGKTVENTQNRMDKNGNALLAKMVWNNPTLDTETYSVSSHTGNAIVNQLDFADLNKYEGSNTQVTYVSRGNWVGTLPKEKIIISLTERMISDLQSKKAIPESVGASMPSYGRNNGLTLASLRGKAYDHPDWEKLLDQMTFEEQSYLLTNGMYSTVVVESVAKPNTKEFDGPTGVVGSKGNLSMPSEGIWASSYNNDLIKRVGEMLAEDARALGYSGLYANAINIHRMPFGGRSHEYFSEDPYLSAIAGVNEVQGIQSKGVIANVKHLAFNDQEDHRAGGSVWLNEQEAREIILLPFEYELSSAEGMGNAHAVMTAMNRIGTDWIGANENVLINIMRGEWGFDGYCITDMAASDTAYIMNYQDGISRGTDLFLGNGSNKALAEFQNNASYCQRMREASHRILYAICNFSAAMNGIYIDTEVSSTSWWWQTAIICVDSILIVLTIGATAMYVLSETAERFRRKENA